MRLEPTFGPARKLAGLECSAIALVEERAFILKHKREKALKPLRLTLASAAF
jgi:hypothetical protein